MVKKYGFFAFTTYMTLLGGNFILYNEVLALRVTHQLLLTAILVYWFWRHGLPNTPLLLPVAGMAAAVLLSIPASFDPRMSLENAWHWLTNLGLFLLAIDWCRRGYIKQLLGGQYASGGVLAGSTIVQRMIEPIRASGIFLGAVNLAGAYCGALALPIAAHIPSLKARWQKVGFTLVLASLGAAMLANGSRGPFLSVAVGLVVLFIAQVKRRKQLLKLLIPALAVLGTIILILWSGHESGDVLRVDLWKSAVQMLTTHPGGVGVGVFGQVYRQTGALASRDDADGLTGAHNTYLNLGAELGWPGLVAGAALLFTVLAIMRKTTWTAHKWAVLAALAGIMAQMLGDNYPAQNWSFLVSLYVAYLVSDSRMKLPGLKTVGRLAGIGILLYCFVLAGFDYAQIYYERSLKGNMVAAMEAQALDPGLKLYSLNVAWLELGRGRIHQIDRTITMRTNLELYALVCYGRRWNAGTGMRTIGSVIRGRFLSPREPL